MPPKKTYQTSEERRLASNRINNEWKERNREYTRQYAREKYRTLACSKEGYALLLTRRAKKYTKDTDIDYEYILGISNICNITKRPFSYVNNYNTFSNPLAPSLDRLNSNRGYYKDNVQVVFNCINKMKNDLANEDFIKLWKDLTIG